MKKASSAREQTRARRDGAEGQRERGNSVVFGAGAAYGKRAVPDDDDEDGEEERDEGENTRTTKTATRVPHSSSRHPPHKAPSAPATSCVPHAAVLAVAPRTSRPRRPPTPPALTNPTHRAAHALIYTAAAPMLPLPESCPVPHRSLSRRAVARPISRIHPACPDSHTRLRPSPDSRRTPDHTRPRLPRRPPPARPHAPRPPPRPRARSQQRTHICNVFAYFWKVSSKLV
ncbi:hypothetical protein HYPSUDRAFT_218171 [Hypholoma sublateritium FD-334 SS-4]|uniref:Uncharacterized protein n=1 Tax=Hypholoma sublateritium (strain FD-334 SS-4) TaxID=945553 RepID=A0A0D2NNX8_HYPSF|nr:hypothetical protein HYPSUDRAFT_218171 [Hypholoma sublateritium FD-334 SS-4]